MIIFLKRQLLQIRKDNSLLFFKLMKLINLVIYFFILLIYFPILIFFLILNIFFFIRMGQVNALRIGHLCSNTDLYYFAREYLRKKKALKKTIDIITHNTPVANTFLFNKIKKKLNIRPSFFFKPLYDLLFFLGKNCKFFKKFLIPSFAPGLFGPGDHDKYDFLVKNPPLISFNVKEKDKGKDLLKNLGIAEKKYICVIFRDSKYLYEKIKNVDWSYHSYRNIDYDYSTEMLNYITSRGYYVVRMGRKVEKKININNDMIIDYSNSNFVSDFADVYLFANCEMCISSGTGPDMITRMFRKPLGMLQSPVGSLHGSSQIINATFPHFCIQKKKILNLEEIEKKKLLNCLTTNGFEKAGVTLIKNDPYFFKNFSKFCLDFLENKFDKSDLVHKQKNIWIKIKKYSRRRGRFQCVLFPASYNHLIN